jgi:hypothetical protein
MPIRMVDDPQDQQEQNFNDNRGGGGRGPSFPVGPGGGGGGGGLLGLLPLLFGSRGGRFLLLIGLAFMAFYFFRGGCQGGGGGILNNISNLTTGGFLDPRQFEKARIYEPLADDNSRNPLPERASLQQYAPQVGDQGKQGSCVAWSSAYAARSILENTRTGGNQAVFSPSFLYNQIGLQGCQGSYIIRAMEYMTKQGSVPYSQFPYSDRDCSTQPNEGMIRNAGQFKMRGFNRLTKGDRNDAIDIRAIKENLAQGAPVVIGMMVGESFMRGMMGKDLWIPEANDKSMMGFGGHAMCVVGYDEKKYGGAFLIMNSWGPQWGTNGFAWVRYPEFNYFVREAYGLEPMARTGALANAALQCEVGLVTVAYDGKKTVPQGYVALRKAGDDLYANTTPMKVGTRFKMEVRNSSECFIYIFGKETNGTAYTLFPYPRTDDPTKSKYSPFCGITGARLFPHDKSMTPDSIGTKDMFAVVVSQEELNWYQLNQQINSQGSPDFKGKVAAALQGGGKTARAQYAVTPKGNIQFTASPQKNEVAVMYVEIDKN